MVSGTLLGVVPGLGLPDRTRAFEVELSWIYLRLLGM